MLAEGQEVDHCKCMLENIFPPTEASFNPSIEHRRNLGCVCAFAVLKLQINLKNLKLTEILKVINCCCQSNSSHLQKEFNF